MWLLLFARVSLISSFGNAAISSERSWDSERWLKEGSSQGGLMLQIASHRIANTFLAEENVADDDAYFKTVPTDDYVPLTLCPLCDFTDLVQNVQNLSFYVQLPGKTCDNTADRDLSDMVLNQKKISQKRGPLKASHDWLWAIDDGDSDSYIQHRLTCHHLLVDSPEEADLCYPSCEPASSLLSNALQKQSGWGEQCFEVPSRHRPRWSECSSICLRNELFDEDPERMGPDELGRCLVEVPYLTGISWPPPSDDIHAQNAPWMLDFPRPTLLAFVGAEERGSVGGEGGSWEGAVERKTILEAMWKEALQINPRSPKTVLSTRIIAGDDLKWDWNEVGPSEKFWVKAWSLYASANFSWQPHGDTATRRALYDALLFGSIPVVDTKAFNAYRRLFLGKLWRGTRVEDVFVVIPEGKEKDGQFIIQMLINMSPEDVDLRRSRLKQLASALQWSAHTPGGADAFLLALGVFRS